MAAPTMVQQSTVTLAGRPFGSTKSVTGGLDFVREASVPAAKAGTLSARTDNDTGNATLGAGHGITDGSRVDVYWDGGSRRGMTVGTVAGTTVPLDGGAGDNLPAASTVIQVAVAVEKKIPIEGDDLVGLAFYTDAKGTFVLTGDDDVEDYSRVIEATGNSVWRDGDPDANPIVGDVITKVYMSHADTTGSKTMRVGVLVV